jgi:pimeloyl-ACP methyl ester carboxylesterase
MHRLTPAERAAVRAALWSGLAAAVIAAVVATVAAAAVPHARGIGFFPALRLAIVTPACFAVGIAAALVYRALVHRVARPRVALAAALAALAALLLAGMAAAGPRGLAVTAIPVVLGASASIAWLVPVFLRRPWRSRVGAGAVVLLGALEIAGVVGALSSETPSPASSDGLPFDVPRAMFDVDHRFIVLSSGARVHYVDEGAGETLLFLHGNPAWSFQWRDLIRDLRGSYRCVALDYPGFGLSTAAAGFGFTPEEQSRVVEELVDRLDLHDVTLVMQDWGGPIGVAFAEQRPERVRALVLGSTWAWPTAGGEPRGVWSAIAGGPVGELAQVNFNGVAAAGIHSSILRKLPPEVIDLYGRPFVPLDRRGVAAFYPAEITAANEWFARLEAGLPRVRDKKTLILWALEDRGFPRSDLARWERALPDHETIELAGAGHFFFEDASDRVISEIRSFVPSTCGVTGSIPPGRSPRR